MILDPGRGFDAGRHIDGERPQPLHGIGHRFRREAAGRPGTSPTDPLPVVDDLVFASTKHTVVPKLELGLFHDVAFAISLPYVVDKLTPMLADALKNG